MQRAEPRVALGSRLVSRIVPVYNGERFLGEALDSILAQPYRPLGPATGRSDPIVRAAVSGVAR